ncbi:hypothetical protein FRC11_014488 [Ceratobasidium sp. 423]|nr:hypothetical protein FRC11_014488 [Ceratobasidium sp. 423]
MEHVMRDSASSSLIAIDIKDSEMDLRDLGTLVRHSTLASKDSLGRDLKLFVEGARAAGGSLQRFGSRVWGVSLLPETSGGFFSSITNPPIPIERQPDTIRREKMLELWLRAIELLDQALHKLIHEAQANVGFLQRLEERLNNIQDMAIAEEENLRNEE